MNPADSLPNATPSSQDLESARVDTAVAVGKGILGAVPIVGSLIAEVVSVFIPNQRLERLTRFVQVLEERLAGIEKERIEAKLADEGYVDLLEDGMQQASRALTDDRRDYIASLLANSLSREQLSHAEEKRLLDLLGQLSDPEIIILQSHALHPALGDRHFYDKHAAVLHGPRVHMGSSQEDVDRAALHRTFRQRLISLGLIQPRFKKPGRNESPEFDPRTGMMKAAGYEITSLGKLLLRYLDLPTGRATSTD